MCPLQSEDHEEGSAGMLEAARGLELEQRLLESRLRQQQLQSEEDSKWLLKEENNLKKRLSITASTGSDDLAMGSATEDATMNSGSATSQQRSPVTTSCSSPRQHSLESRQHQPDKHIVKVSYFILSGGREAKGRLSVASLILFSKTASFKHAVK